MIYRKTLPYLVFLTISLMILIPLYQKCKNISIFSSYSNLQAREKIFLDESPDFEERSKVLSQNKDTMKILIWNPFTPKKGNYWNIIFKRLLSQECPENRCTLIYNKSQHEMAEAILFSDSFMNIKKNYEVPPTHPGNQLWILYGGEADHFMRFGPREYYVRQLSSIGINWTMHFRLDSDIVSSYGVFREIEDSSKTSANDNTDIWSTKDKNKVIAWMVSNCNANSKRHTYVNELKKYISVDVYGSCGKMKCGSTQGVTTGNIKMKECNELTKKYFFYLALENTFCKDYVTEKFFRSLSLDVIPVVMGGADYTHIAPPHSYINFMDFKTPKHLADYLKQLTSDPVLYNKYFEWKSHYTMDIGYPYAPFVCGLCEKLHLHRSSIPMTQTTLDLRKWLNNDECHHCSWEDVLNNKTICQLKHR